MSYVILSAKQKTLSEHPQSYHFHLFCFLCEGKSLPLWCIGTLAFLFLRRSTHSHSLAVWNKFRQVCTVHFGIYLEPFLGAFPGKSFRSFLPGTLVTIHHYKIPLCQFILLRCPSTCRSPKSRVFRPDFHCRAGTRAEFVDGRVSVLFLKQNKAPAANGLSFVAVFLPTATQSWSRCLWSNFLQALEAWKGFVCWRRRKYGTERKIYWSALIFKMETHTHRKHTTWEMRFTGLGLLTYGL